MIPALRVLLTGDAFGGKFLPALARPAGGNGVEFPNTLTKALPLTRNIDMIITGHGGVAKPQDLEVHRDFMRDFLESTRRAKKAGQTAAAAAKAVDSAGHAMSATRRNPPGCWEPWSGFTASCHSRPRADRRSPMWTGVAHKPPARSRMTCFSRIAS